MAGSVLRYLVSSSLQRLLSDAWFPYGTFSVNMAGSFLIGAVGALVHIRGHVPPELPLLIIIGFLGGFTTFSSLAFESFLMVKQAHIPGLMLNLGLHFLIGIAAVWTGWTLVEAWAAGR